VFQAPALPRTLAASLRDVASKQPAVRESAVRDLVKHADEAREEVVRALEKALRDDEAPTVRSAAALGLADVGGSEALPALLVAMEDADVHVRQMAITALGEIGDCRATERLRRALTDQRAEVRFQAVIAYARVCTDRSSIVEALLDRLQDADPLVCHISLRVAEEVAERSGGEIEPSLLDRAKDLLKHKSPLVRVAAAIALARTGSRLGSKVLADVIGGTITTQDPEDDAAAIELAGTLGLEEARVGLEKRAFGGIFGRDRHAWHARVALARMGHERATREIMKELESWDRSKRTLAVAAIGRAKIRQAEPLLRAMLKDSSRADLQVVQDALAALDEAPQSDHRDKPAPTLGDLA
jgi:HEAT repeat protein